MHLYSLYSGLCFRCNAKKKIDSPISDINKDCFIDVPCIDIIDFISQLSPEIDILKIDIEGGEYDILEKLIITGLYKRIKHVLVETHDHHIPDIITKGKVVRNLIKKYAISNINLNWM